MKYWNYPKKIAQYDLTGNILKIWKNTKTASEELNITFSRITDCCRGKTKRAGIYIFRYIIDNKIIYKIEGLYMFGQYSLDGNFIKLWNSTHEIENELGINSKYVMDCGNNKRNKVDNYIFIKIFDSKNIQPSISIKKYNRYDKNGIYIDSFISLQDIKDKLNINPYNISRCISGKLNSYKGFIWKYE